MSVVVDASAMLTWFFGDEDTAYAAKISNFIIENGAYAPSLFPIELCNVLLAAGRRGRIKPPDLNNRLLLVQSLPIQIRDVSLDEVAQVIYPLAQHHGLTVYDACYLALAMKLKLPLATLDQALEIAAKRCFVTIF